MFLDIPSGKRLHNYGKIHHFSWENPLYIAIFNSYFDITRGYPFQLVSTTPRLQPRFVETGPGPKSRLQCTWTLPQRPHRFGHVERVEPSNFGVNSCVRVLALKIHVFVYYLYIYIHTYILPCPNVLSKTSFWKITFRNMARRALVLKFSCLGWLVVTSH